MTEQSQDPVEQDSEVEQYSDQSRARLRAAASALVAAIEVHTAEILALGGGTAEDDRLFELNDDVRRAAQIWDDAVWDHTGTFPIAVEYDDGEDEEEQDEKVEPAEFVSVVARWDLAVTDRSALIEAARGAHRRLWESESEKDAAAAVAEDEIGRALYTLVHEFGDPWFDLPGIAVLAGRRAYLTTSASEEAVEGDDDDEASYIPTVPDGELLYSESW